ncbi:MAG: hypothetical protein ABIJ86_16645 [Spirochaetota bacterium]
MRGIDALWPAVHNHRSLFVNQCARHGSTMRGAHKETYRALRKKAEAQKDSDPQAEEKEEKEQTQDPQVISPLSNGSAPALETAVTQEVRPFFLALVEFSK